MRCIIICFFIQRHTKILNRLSGFHLKIIYLLLKDINGAMSDTSLVPQLAAEAVRAYIGGKDGIEVAAAGKLADALRARLASEAASGVTVVTDESVGSGFSIRLAGGRIEHSFTGKAVAEALSKQLRPRLAALLK